MDATEMGLRPQMLNGLADSPVQLVAWMLDHGARSYEVISRAFVDGDPVGNLTRDEVLDKHHDDLGDEHRSLRVVSTGRSSASSTSRASASRLP
jgi:hypothetical protein